MFAAEYLGKSRLFQRLKKGPYGHIVDLYTERLVKDGLDRAYVRRCFNRVGGFLNWITQTRLQLSDIDEGTVERYLRHWARELIIRSGKRAALERLLFVLREAGMIPPRQLLPLSAQDQLLEDFGDYLRSERGLMPRTIAHHKPIIRRFLNEVCPGSAGGLGKIGQENVIRYIERHANDGSPYSAKAMCYSLRAFLRYLHHAGLNPRALAFCLPAIRRRRFTMLPTYLSAAQVQKVLALCDRSTATGRRDYAILMLLAKLGLRAGEVASLTLDDIDWRAGEMLVCGKGWQRARMPMPKDVAAAVIAYLRNGRPRSSCRQLFLRAMAPKLGFRTSCSITNIARSALQRAGIHGYPRLGAHLFRHSLATELLRSGASLAEIGQLLRHESHDTTRIYAKVDIEALKSLSLPWPGGVQ